MAARREPILTIADIGAMPEDGNHYELIEGELFVSCAPSLAHQRIVRRLLRALDEYLDSNLIGEVFPGPGVIFSNFSGVIPDIAFVGAEQAGEIASGDRITGPPDLVIEVLSPGAENQRRDRHAKRQLYRKYGVKEYWIVDAFNGKIEVYRTARLRLVSSFGGKDELISSLLPGFRCQVKRILQ